MQNDFMTHAYNLFVGFFQGGGLFMYPIALVLTVGLAIAIERFLFLNEARESNREVWEKILPLLLRGDYQRAGGMAALSDTAIGKMLRYGLERLQTSRKREDIEMAMEECLMEELPRIEKRTHYLSMFSTIATLLGLLGTVWGLIEAFSAVSNVNPVEKADLLAASISVAMNCTAFGLMTAIPMLLIHSYLQTRSTELVESLEMASVKFLNTVTGAAPQPAKAPEPAASTGHDSRKDLAVRTSRYSRRLHRSHLRSARAVTLNIVPMIDVFAILVFFLLSNAALVFAKLHILEMNLPSATQVNMQQHDPGLQVVIRRDVIEVRQRDGAGAQFVHRPDGYDVSGLSALMQQLKQRYPAARDATILLEPDIVYNDLVQVLDAVRAAPSARPGLVPGAELFPDISLGDASEAANAQ